MMDEVDIEKSSTVSTRNVKFSSACVFFPPLVSTSSIAWLLKFFHRHKHIVPAVSLIRMMISITFSFI